MYKSIICLAAAAALTAAPALAQERERPPRNTITVNGAGESTAAPDIALVSVGVVTTARRAQEAAQANAAQTQKVVAALKAQGIAEKDIQTGNYSVSPRHEGREGREPVIVGYTVNNQVTAKVRKTDSVGAVIDAALEAGANNIQYVSFGLENRDAAEGAALTDAMKSARRKAETMAAAAGVRIARVLEIHEGPIYRPVPQMEAAFRMGIGGAAAPTPIAPGELTITASVTVVYLLEGGERQARIVERSAARRR